MTLELLREPFPPHQISTIPKGGVKLSYVGHAALTDRLLDADPMWTWEPLALDERGMPNYDGFGGLWIRLTVCGVTRLGYGHAGSKEGGDAVKEIIGDALRNAAMRFGAALDLWHKGELHKDDDSLVPALEASIEQAKQRKAGVMGAVLDTIVLDAKVKTALAKLAFEVGEAFKHPEEGAGLAYDRIEIEELNGEEKLYLWSLLDSKIRSALKREQQTRAMKEHA